MSRIVMIAILLMLVPGCPETMPEAPETNQEACERLNAHLAALPCATGEPDAFMDSDCDEFPEDPECDFPSFIDCLISNLNCDDIENDPGASFMSFLECFDSSGLGSMECLALAEGSGDPCTNNPCDNGLACDGLETCAADGGQAVCADGKPLSCGFLTFCTEPDGACVDPCDGADCSDDNDCTTDTCTTNEDGTTTCNNDTACDDSDACTEGDACGEDGVCAGTPLDCGPGMFCSPLGCIVEPE